MSNTDFLTQLSGPGQLVEFEVERPLGLNSHRTPAHIDCGTWFLSYLSAMGLFENEDTIDSGGASGTFLKDFGDIKKGWFATMYCDGKYLNISAISPESIAEIRDEYVKQKEEDEDDYEDSPDTFNVIEYETDARWIRRTMEILPLRFSQHPFFYEYERHLQERILLHGANAQWLTLSQIVNMFNCMYPVKKGQHVENVKAALKSLMAAGYVEKVEKVGRFSERKVTTYGLTPSRLAELTVQLKACACEDECDDE